MAKVFLIGLEKSASTQICRALEGEPHEIESQLHGADLEDILRADIVFADGSGNGFLSLLRAIRRERPSLPFIMVTNTPEMTGWLDALEAGATDYCSAPLDPLQIKWIMESALRRPKTMAA